MSKKLKRPKLHLTKSLQMKLLSRILPMPKRLKKLRQLMLRKNKIPKQQPIKPKLMSKPRQNLTKRKKNLNLKISPQSPKSSKNLRISKEVEALQKSKLINLTPNRKKNRLKSRRLQLKNKKTI